MDCIINGKSETLVEDMRYTMEKYGYAIIRNFFEKDIIKSKVKDLKKKFKSKNDIRISGPNYYKMKNYQRLDLGDYSQVNARFSRMITEFTWNSDGYFYDEFQKLISLRNSFHNFSSSEEIYNYKGVDLCDLPKILHYPTGGGFMNEHYDHYNNDGVINILVSLTKRGEDFESGGVYYVDKNNKFIDAESILEIGDVYVHLPSTLHGVKAIDSNKNIDLFQLHGRMSMLLSCEEFKIR